MESIAILGSTGSIGTQALEVVAGLGKNVAALAANNNVALLEKQIRRFHPSIVCMRQERAAKELKLKIKDTFCRVVTGEEGVCECASYAEADTVLNAVVGIAGLRPTLCAIESGKVLALANKESLVTGGSLVTRAAQKKGVAILPVDSEHSAIFQCLQGKPENRALKRIVLTASGGPFFGRTRHELENVTVEEALNHPNWDMGAKITIDSATMMNKGLELIEAVWLFHVPPEMVDIVVHRESVVHSLVEYSDNSMIAQMGVPDMSIPIQYALTYPDRYPSPAEALDLTQYGSLTFYQPDEETFSCIGVCREAIQRGGLSPAAANGANEEAVNLFLHHQIKFTDIGALVREAMERQPVVTDYTLEDVFEADRQARCAVREAAGAES